MAGLLLFASLLTAFGWRYGFTPLPQPIPGCVLEPLPDLPWSQVTTNNVWFWFRELDRTLVSGSRTPQPGTGPGQSDPGWNRPSPWTPVVEAWSHTGQLPGETRTRIESWIQDHPGIQACLDGAVRSTDNRSPTPPDPVMPERVLLLSHYALVVAAAHEADGQPVAALKALTAAWALQARLTPVEEFAALYDERGSAQLNAWLARPWRRVALTARALPWPETRLLLSDVAATTNALPPLEQSYRRQWPAQPEDLAATQRTDWLRVQSAFRVAGLRLRQEFGRVVSGLLERLVGGRRPAPLQAEGARHLVRPLAELLVALQHATARDNDLRQIREARFSHGLAALRRIGPYAPPETPPRNAGRIRTPPLAPWPDHHRWPWVLRMLDRPAVWKASRDLPDSAALQTSRKEWLLQLESCRLALALRAYHDLHGRWPAAWQDLVPDILPAVPIDPFSNQPFGYESSPNGWEFWSVDAIGRRPTPDAAQDPSQKLFRSSEFGPARSP